MRTAELTEGGSYAYQLVARTNSDGPAALVVEALLDAIEPGHPSGNSLAITTPDRQVQDRRCRPQELLAPWPTWLNDRAMEAAKERRWDWRKDGLIGRARPWEYVYDSSTQDRAATWHPDAMERGGGSWFDFVLGPGSDSDPDHLVTIRVESVEPVGRPDGVEQIGPEQDWPLGVLGRRVDDDRPVWIPNPLRLAPAGLIEQWSEQMTEAAARRRRAMIEAAAAWERYGLADLPERLLRRSKVDCSGGVNVTASVADVVSLAERLASSPELLAKARAEVAVAALEDLGS